MDFESEEVLIALVDRSEFEEARRTIAGFEPWISYDDYRSEREGRLIGLAVAGQRARFVPVSLRAFLDWSASSGAQPTAGRLDVFAALGASIGAFSGAAQGSADPRAVSAGPWTVYRPTGRSVDLASYRAWLSCLCEKPSDALLDAYVALIVESRGESSLRSAVAD